MKNKWNWEKLWENLPAVILSVAAALILFFFHRLGLIKDEVLTVPITTAIHSNLIIAENVDLRARLTIRRKIDQPQNVKEEDLVILADFLSHTKEGTYRSALKVTKRPGSTLNLKGIEIALDPQEINLKLEKKVTRSVPINLSLSDSVAPGFEMRSWSLNPTSVTVEGPRTRMELLKSIGTEQMELQDQTGPFKKEVILITEDPLLRILEKDKPILIGEILETRNTKIWPEVPVIPLNLSPGLTPVSKLPSVSLRVQGPFSLLEDLQDEDINAEIDLQGLTQPGDYRVQVAIRVPEGMQVLDLTPRFLDIVLKKKDGP